MARARSDINFDRNPHLRHNDQGTISVCNYSDSNRLLDLDNAPRREYFVVPHKQRSVNHWGQRKLLLSEIEFLTNYSNKNESCTVVYAGAAPGSHIPYLAELFPNLKFELYDPAPFSISNSARINIHNGFFNDKAIENLLAKKLDILFISDIRTGDPKIMSNDEVERNVARDMEMQKQWVLALKPLASMLKFRLPWDSGTTSYLKGVIYLPVWGPQTTTEARLVVHATFDDFDYDNKKYEQQMFYFNTVTRVQYYNHEYTTVSGLDHCYDCASEMHILESYLYKHRRLVGRDLRHKAGNMSLELSGRISTGRTLGTVVNEETRKNWFDPRIVDPTDEKVTTFSKKPKNLFKKQPIYVAKEVQLFQDDDIWLIERGYSDLVYIRDGKKYVDVNRLPEDMQRLFNPY